MNLNFKEESMLLFFKILFLIFSILLICRFIAYGLYEIKSNNNKSGGISYIVFSSTSIIFCTLVIFIAI